MRSPLNVGISPRLKVIEKRPGHHLMWVHCKLKRVVLTPRSYFSTDTRNVIMTLSKIVFTPRVVLTPMWSQNDSLLESLYSFKES